MRLKYVPAAASAFTLALCIGCRNCVGACPFGAAIWDAAHEKPTICSGCGYCVDYCAYDVLKLKELPAAQEEVVYVGK